MSTAHDRAIQLLEDARLATDGQSKAEALLGLKELLIHAHPKELIPALLAEVLELRLQPQSAVRRELPEIIDGASKALPTLDTLLQCTLCLLPLLSDDVSAVARRAAQLAYPLLRACVVAVARSQDVALSGQLWDAARSLPAATAELAKRESATENARLSALRALESCALLLSAERLPAVEGLAPSAEPLPPRHPVLTRATLTQEADNVARELASIVRDATGDDQQTGLAIAEAGVRAAGLVAAQRPQFLGRLGPAMLALAARLGNESILVKGLIASLNRVLHSSDPRAAAWSRKIEAALDLLEGTSRAGVNGASSGQLAMEQQQYVSSNSVAQAPSSGVGTSEQRSSTNSTTKRPAKRHRPNQNWSSHAEINALVDALIEQQNAPALAETLQDLQNNEMFADVVLARLEALPPPPSNLLDVGQYAPWAEEFLALSSATGGQEPEDEFSVQSSSESDNDADLESLPEPPKEEETNEPVDAALGAGLAAQLRSSQAASTSIHTDEPSSSSTGGSSSLRSSLRHAALQRILQRVDARAARNGSSSAVRARLVGRLAACQPDLADDLLASLKSERFHERNGETAILEWLHAVFAKQVHGSSSLSADEYSASLNKALQSVKESLPPSDRTLIRMLLDAPALPREILVPFLASLLDMDDETDTTQLEWATLGLLAARDLILQRPPARDMSLQAVLGAAKGPNAALRDRAVRLLANRLWPALGGSIQPHILEAARASLDGLLCPEPSQVKVEQGIDVAVEENGSNGTGAEAQPSPPTEEADQKEQQTPNEKKGVQAAMAACALYCALITKQPALLRYLYTVFGCSNETGKAGILKFASSLATTLGPLSPSFLELLDDLPENSLELALCMLNALTAVIEPPEPLVLACLKLAEREGPRALLPVLPALAKPHFLERLPTLLSLSDPELSRVFSSAVASNILTASELLVALHTLEGGDLRRVIAALGICLSDPGTFPVPTIVAALSALLTRVPLPPLLMRTALQAQAATPELARFVASSVLPAMARGRAWEDPRLWKGWLLAAARGAPATFPALLALPAAQLESALRELPAETARQLAQETALGKRTVPADVAAALKRFVVPHANAASSSDAQ